MKKILLSIIALIALGLTACDKIDSDEYIVYAGAVGTWYDDTETIPATQRVLVEKYTGCRCINCPTADEVIHTAQQRYGEQLVALSIHPNGSNYTIPFTGESDLRTEVGKIWNDAFGFNAYPQALLNRNGEVLVPTTNFDNHIDALLARIPQVAVAVECEPGPGDSLHIIVHVTLLTALDAELNLTLAISEDGIITSQKMPNGSTQTDYVQNHVLRSVITDTWGAPIDKGTDGNSSRVAHFHYKPDVSWNLSNCHIVAFVSLRDDANHSILNVAECTIRP